MAFGNLSFETAGGAAGYASLWRVVVASTVEGIETYGPAPREPWEDFDRGFDNDDYLTAFTSADVAAASFDSALPTAESVEDFEEGWGNDTYKTSFVWPVGTFSGDLTAAVFDASTVAYEDFEDGWGNDTYKLIFVWPVGTFSADLQAAMFDSGTEGYEDFEEDWTGLLTYKVAFLFPGDIAVATFDSGGAPEDYEDFEEVPTEYVLTADPATDEISCIGHPYANGQQVMLRNVGGHLPGGVDDLTTYFIIDMAIDSFSLALTDGGSIVNITSAGVGTHYVRLLDKTAYWTTLLLGV